MKRKSINIITPIKYDEGKNIKSQIPMSVLSIVANKYSLILVFDGAIRCLPKECTTNKLFKSLFCNYNSAGASRNLGISHAEGKYVVFLDSDDIFCQDMLEKAYCKMEENQLDVCIWNAWEYDHNTGEVYDNTTHLRPELLPHKEVFSGKEAEYILNLTSAAPWNKMYSRKYLMEHGFQYMEQKYYNDIYFVQQALVNAERISVINEELMYYRINSKDSLQSNRSKGIKDLVDALTNTYLKFNTDGIYKGTVRTSHLNYVLSCTIAVLKSGLEDYALEELICFVKECPIYKEIKLEDVHYYQKDFYDELQRIIMDEIKRTKERYQRLAREKTKRTAIKTMEFIYPDNYMELMYSDYCLKEIRKSKAYKLGLALTWPFRKIKRARKQ